jgi:hypothetical protein
VTCQEPKAPTVDVKEEVRSQPSLRAAGVKGYIRVIEWGGASLHKQMFPEPHSWG